jgi:hypothetical protein
MMNTIEHWQQKLSEAKKEHERLVPLWGVRLGIQAQIGEVCRRIANYNFQIERIQFNQHNAGECDAATCHDCYIHSIAPDKWPERGAKIEGAVYTR